MKIIAILLVIVSVSKLMIAISNDYPNDSIINDPYINDTFDPNCTRNIFYTFLVGDGLIGLFCSIFILFA